MKYSCNVSTQGAPGHEPEAGRGRLRDGVRGRVERLPGQPVGQYSVDIRAVNATSRSFTVSVP